MKRFGWHINARAMSRSGMAWLISTALATPAASQTCVPQNEFIALDPALVGLDAFNSAALGAYERISPDGRFVLRSYSGKNLTTVTLIELPEPLSDQPVRLLQTPLGNEAFPVQGSWRYLVDVDGSHFLFKDVLQHQKGAIPRFKAGMTGFYAAAAEVTPSSPTPVQHLVQIRSLSWPNANAQDEAQGQGSLTVKTISVDTTEHRVVSDTGTVHLCTDRAAIDGSMYALPMLSVDGLEFAAMPQMPKAGNATMRIFGLGELGKDCVAKSSLDVVSGKLTFGFSSPTSALYATSRNSDVVYEYRGQVWWLPRQGDVPLNLAPWDADGKAGIRHVTAHAFPGLTRDGRVIYAATWQRCALAPENCRSEGGYVIADPLQSNAYQHHLSQLAQKSDTKHPRDASTPLCITTEKVRQERSRFARFHGLTE